jgi:hypothetical protein
MALETVFHAAAQRIEVCGGLARAAGRWTVLRVENRPRPNFWLAVASAGYGSGSGNYLGRKSPVTAPHAWQRIRTIGTVAASTATGATDIGGCCERHVSATFA